MYKNNNQQIRQFMNENIKNCTVLVVGDIMLDKYYFGEVKKISPEAPVPVTRIVREERTLGGAANVAHNLASLGCKTILAGVTGRDESRESLLRLLEKQNIGHEGLTVREGPTTVKLRVIGGHQQMIRLDFEETKPIPLAVETEMKIYLDKAMAENRFGSVIISDYAKGVCTPSLCQYIIKKCVAKNIPVIIDPKKTDWHKYDGASYITPNLRELNAVSAQTVENRDEEISCAAQKIRRKHHIKNIVVTRSEQGLSLISARRVLHIPTLAQEVFDISGAGDTVIAVLAAAVASGLTSAAAAFLANLAAGVVVGKVGTYAISQAELLTALESFH